jgi:nucleoside-diphosphate-sugar epimerase
MSDKVLVTGATGFIAQHCILQLLEQGYQVRGTARSAGRTREIADVLAPHLSAPARGRLADDFETVVAELRSDEGWDDAMVGCRFVLHVASPFPSQIPRDENDLIIPAREGALRALRSASRAGVDRVVLTSSIAAVAYGQDRDHVFDESDWSNVQSPKLSAYDKSKTLAERAAWDYMDSLGSDSTMDLVVINPGLVLGPLLSKQWSLSAELIIKLMNRAIPAIPDLRVAGIDVRDVATAHVRAMTISAASGQRFLCCIESCPVRDVAMILSEHFNGRGFKIPTARLPGFLMPIFAIWDKQVRMVLSEIGQPLEVDTTKIRTVLDLAPRGLQEMSVSMADSLIRYGVVTPRR